MKTSFVIGTILPLRQDIYVVTGWRSKLGRLLVKLAIKLAGRPKNIGRCELTSGAEADTKIFEKKL